ncbi:hypothetical protein GIB23_15610 [Pseudomonas putida]|uniref:hypothetical protein n=1 Tax=Pseudomonas putida TaxID=303 RepID=UPI001A8E5F84|nr:hypothetical protein [Pseudomonas putida]MBO0368513.1 hypothetical protein [Pseudomonas putida]
MKHTLARKAFKRQLGQANHFLVTTLVGLDCLDNNPQHQASGLHAAWSPKSVPQSIQRARIFVLHSFMGTAVDALDVYFSLLNRKPDFLQDSHFSQSLQACKRSVYKKAAAFASWVPTVEIEAALVEVLITWRNNVMHELADNLISSHSKCILRESSKQIAIQYCNLDSSSLLGKAESGADLTFKETASLISAAHKFVEAIDHYVLAKLDRPTFYLALLDETLKLNPGNFGFRTRLFDTKAKRWESFVSNWASNTLHASPLSIEDLQAIKSLIPKLKEA